MNSDAQLGARTFAPARIIRSPLAVAGGAAALAVSSLAATMAPSPAAHSAPAPTPAMLPPGQVVRSPVEYLGSSAAPAQPQRTDDSNHLRATGRIGPDLTAALQSAGVPESLGREYVGVLGRAISLHDGLSVEDRFDVIYERGEGGRLLYAGLDRVARADLELVKWTDGKETIWVNADPGATSTGRGEMRLPVAGRLTSGFGQRFHPILGHSRMHKGVDLGAASGAPIVAAADGRVVAAGWHGGYGRQIAIAHPGGIRSTYSHMSRIAAHPGQTVRQGQVIGYVGSSGLSTGPHLHYEVYKNGRPVNPMSVKLAVQPQIQGEKLHALRDRLRSLLTLSSPRA